MVVISLFFICCKCSSAQSDDGKINVIIETFRANCSKGLSTGKRTQETLIRQISSFSENKNLSDIFFKVFTFALTISSFYHTSEYLNENEDICTDSWFCNTKNYGSDT